MMPKTNKIEVYAFFLLIVITFLNIRNFNLIDRDPERAKTAKQQEAAQSLFGKLQLEGRSAIVYDIETGKVVYEVNPNKKLPIASITKVMTALVASSLLPERSTVTLSNVPESSSTPFLKNSDEWRLKELLDYTLVVSSNEGARAIAQSVQKRSDTNFIDDMNRFATTLHLDNTHFNNETGLDIAPGVGGSYSTAEDVAKLMAYIVKTKPELLESTRQASAKIDSPEGTVYVNNTNEIAGKIPGLIASKTGLTDTAGGNLAVVFDAGLAKPVVVVVLGSSEEGRFRDVKKLVDATIGYFARNQL